MGSTRCNDKYEQQQHVVPMRMYWDQCSSSRKRGHKPPTYSKQELVNWINNNESFQSLYDNWADSGFESDLRPSVDRLDNSFGYSFDNIELVTWATNQSRARTDIMSGKLLNNQEIVHQYSADGSYMATFHSQAEAERQVPNSNQQNISACCYGKIQHSAGFQWSFDKVPFIGPTDIFTDWKHSEIYQYNQHTGELIDIFPSQDYIINHTVYDMNHVRHSGRDKSVTHHNTTWDISYLQPKYAKCSRTKGIRSSIIQSDRDGNIINTFGSMLEASQSTGIRDGNISKCCNGKAKSAGGFIWSRQLNQQGTNND